MAIARATELLATWEAGVDRTPDGRALLLHRVARPDTGGDGGELLSLPVGAREADLFTLRRALFGERMQVRLECAACAADMEFDLDAGVFAHSLPAPGSGTVRVAEGGSEVEFRVPTVGDLRVAARHADARSALLARCLLSWTRDGQEVDRAGGPLDELLPPSLQRRIAEAVEAADPAADVTLSISCPECEAATRAELDIASYLWTELDAWARDLLLDVHLLATAYGWSEPQIMALSPLRRRYYLELCADV